MVWNTAPSRTKRLRRPGRRQSLFSLFIQDTVFFSHLRAAGVIPALIHVNQPRPYIYLLALPERYMPDGPEPPSLREVEAALRPGTLKDNDTEIDYPEFTLNIRNLVDRADNIASPDISWAMHKKGAVIEVYGGFWCYNDPDLVTWDAKENNVMDIRIPIADVTNSRDNSGDDVVVIQGESHPIILPGELAPKKVCTQSSTRLGISLRKRRIHQVVRNNDFDTKYDCQFCISQLQ